MNSTDTLKGIQEALSTSQVGAALVNVARQAYVDQQRLAGALYPANWVTEGDFDAMRDDGGYDNVADMASPSGIILHDLSPKTVRRLLSHVSGDIKAVDELDFPSDGNWERVTIGDSLNQWNLTFNNGEIYAVLIVRKQETVL